MPPYDRGDRLRRVSFSPQHVRHCLPRLLEHEIDDAAGGFLVAVSLKAAKTVEIELTVSAGAHADDGIGFSPEAVATSLALGLLYQFFLHIEAVPPLASNRTGVCL